MLVHLQDSQLQPLADGDVQYYASGWKPFGTTDATTGDTQALELLPGSYSFRLSFRGYTQQKSNINIVATNTSEKYLLMPPSLPSLCQGRVTGGGRFKTKLRGCIQPKRPSGSWIFGNPAVLELAPFRPVTLRPRLSIGFAFYEFLPYC